MPPRQEKSHLKRGRPSAGNQPPQDSSKKPRRSERISSLSQSTPTAAAKAYPSPLTHQESTATELQKEQTVTPPEGRPSQFRHHTPAAELPFSSPPGDTQALSQFVYPPRALADEVGDEAAEGVWGYLIPLDDRFGDALVLKKRDTCSPALGTGKGKNGVPKPKSGKRRLETPCGERTGGYLIGRHTECDFVLDIPTISNRHCLIYHESKRGDSVAILEDLSSNGTFINEAIVGRNKRRELEDGDEITVLDEARFVFRYPKTRDTNKFRQQYRILQQLGKGHFASVYLCVERSTGVKYAVKRFERRPGDSQRSDNDGLQQEIAVLMSVNHPNVLCLKDTFDESDGVYLVLELAPEGELFNWIVAHQKLTENEARKVFLQLFKGLKYLHERNIVHRDIKPENILLVDDRLTVKLADFGLAKIIGEDSFTTTLCGTPSYVAPEILVENPRHRKYSRAVDIWSLGVVLYICLCGFPPFSDELYTRENPYTLAEQIKLGRFDYPSPYWDSVGDPALDLIDRMLTVDYDKRITIDECLEHPWLTGKSPSVNDSTDGLTGAMGQLDFSKRKIARERTLISSINDVPSSQVIGDASVPGSSQVRVFDRNEASRRMHNHKGKGAKTKVKGGQPEPGPAANRDREGFMQLGGKGDPTLYSDEEGYTRGRRR
ncbi:CAMK/RAD53 protein kinase [Helicocarpus griseus UAMH5409]|uniref:CAMK/RAD53 protein kinase n=1 Tax=Helicocarpus griseus UAMH5409 TaxID=1447875 RepID=A0A2B7YBW6_9EURO|nr:CAMK/RAD53 protein kinase [Helicocarpus griseus UAMH5409]